MVAGDGKQTDKRAGGPNKAEASVRTSSAAIDVIESPIEAALRGSVPEWLIHSDVYHRLPFGERARLDRAILAAGQNQKSLDAISAEFDLQNKYGITPAGLNMYAGRIEELMVPTAASQVLAAIISCIPEEHRHKLTDGSQSLLLGQMLTALTSDGAKLGVAEMGKVVALLTPAGQERDSTGRSTTKTTSGRPTEIPDAPDGRQPTKLAESVRMIYGLDWPPKTCEPQPNIQATPVENPTATGIASDRKGSAACPP